MTRYALLVLPSANRVYAEASTALTQAELAVFNRSVLDGRITDIDAATLGGVSYVTFRADHLDEPDAAFLANLSTIFALFEIVDDLLRPVELLPLDRFDDDLVTILKYQGKTNERFTKLLLNVTLLASAFAPEMLRRRFTVLDPLCGRGTTLNQALMYGYHAAGVDLDQKDFEAYSAFIRTWLQKKRIKHHAETIPVRRDKRLIARRLQVTLAATRDAHRTGDTQRLDVVNGETTRCLDFFRPESQDLVVADTPYGIQHGSRTPAVGLNRSPLALLEAAAPVWSRLLRPGGALGISWNTFVASREAAAATLVGAGLEVMDAECYLGFQHRVDQAILRDVIVARKPSRG